MLSALWSTGTSCLKPAEPHAKRTSAWKAAPPADPALEGCLPVSARSQTYPCTHKAKPVHSRARSKKSCSGKPQLPFPLQKLCKIFRPWKHFLPTQGIFRLMVHQTSQSRKTLVWLTSVWVWGRVGKKKKKTPLGHQSFPQSLNRRLWAELGATRNKPKTRQAGKGKPHRCLVPLSDTGIAESKRSLMESINLPFGMLSKTQHPHVRSSHAC